MKGLQCSKALYLNQYYKKLRDPIGQHQQALFNRGHEVGDVAWSLFPEGVDARAQYKFNYTQAVQKTLNLMKKGLNTLFEPTFQEEGVLVMLDILDRQDEDDWVAYEVKSSSKVNKNHIRDAALQYFVLEKAGIQLTDFYILHIDKKYVRHGELESEKLFQQQSIIEDVQAYQTFISEHVDRCKAILAKETVPKVPIGEHCTTPYPCDFIGYCWGNIPDNSVFQLGFLDKETKFDLYKQGYVTIDSIPSNIDLDLSEAVHIQIESHKNQMPFSRQAELRAFLNTLVYPLFYVDFEVIMPVIPLFNGTRPYEKLPFQYSLHYQEAPGVEPVHYEFLADPGPDPRRAFMEQFLADTEGTGSLVVFEDQLERRILNKLKHWFPEYEEALQDRLDRTKDLRTPFHNMDYYHPSMKGQFSLKAIYEALTVQSGEDGSEEIEHGGIASVIYEQLMKEPDPVQIAEKREKLLAYCKKDTKALVTIEEALRNLVTQ